MGKCAFHKGISIRPNGVDELDPCMYETVQKLRNVTVEILRCKKCGQIEISWYRQDNTEEDDQYPNFCE